MKKPRSVEPTKLNHKSSRNRAHKLDCDKKAAKKSFYDLSIPLFFSFWCGVVLFHAKFGITRGNEENGYESLPNPNGVVMEQDVSVIVEDFSIRDVHPNVEDLISGTGELEELLSIMLGYDSFTCQMEPHEEVGKSEPQAQNGRIHLTYPNLDEFKYISSKGKSGSPRQLVNITHRLEPDGTPYNYASASKGAKVVAHNKEAKGASNILDKDDDKYLRNPCSVGGKFFIIELADETLIDAVKIANFEHHSSNFKDIELYGSLVYPTEAWDTLGSFVAANSKHVQCFKLPEPKWVRYLKVNLLSHYGYDFYCTLSVVEVFGVDAIEQMLEDLIIPSGDSSANGLPNPNSTALPSAPELSSNSSANGDVARPVVEPVSRKGVGSVDEGKNLTLDIPKKPVSASGSADLLQKVRQLPNSRLHADAALKVVLQKVRSLELNLSVLEEYIKELNRRRVDYLPELDKELNKFSTLLERTKLEMKNLLEWKEIMERGILELESWRTVVSTQMEILVNQNSMLRLEVEKVVQDQVSLENKGLAIFSVSFCFASVAVVKMILERVAKQFRAPASGAASNGGWILVLIFCSMTMLIPLLYG
ncbi:SUN domain-containing protein 5 isoform X2 [Salvia miltiorrhiza]|uniref:SUN domain-containing protein 5 isoform X2 n=1 Tax=Salvia miltiorrhiza TaxID=226208 RepID=UPI0025ACDEBA|nr:SUN domain-containing protein 5 isoform X2 [Salvia miltiorrhiza]